MTDYDNLSKIDLLPELEGLDLRGKAKVIQSLLEESFFHPSGLFYSILLIDGPHHVRPVGRATGYSEMLSHEWLTPDHAVQRTRFANGVVVTVNLGDAQFKLLDGTMLQPMDLSVEGMK